MFVQSEEKRGRITKRRLPFNSDLYNQYRHMVTEAPETNLQMLDRDAVKARIDELFDKVPAHLWLVLLGSGLLWRSMRANTPNVNVQIRVF